MWMYNMAICSHNSNSIPPKINCKEAFLGNAENVVFKYVLCIITILLFLCFTMSLSYLDEEIL